jgi:hypothetical protein
VGGTGTFGIGFGLVAEIKAGHKCIVIHAMTMIFFSAGNHRN